MEGCQISEYEILRNGNIKRNESFLLTMGFGTIDEAKISVPRKRKAEAIPIQPKRVSQRLRNVGNKTNEALSNATLPGKELSGMLHLPNDSEHYCSNCRLLISFEEGVNLQKAIGGHNSRCRISCQRSYAGKPNYYESPEEDEDHEDGNQSSDDRRSTSGIDSGKLPMSMLEYQEELHLKYSADGDVPFRTRNRKRQDQGTIIQQKGNITSDWRHYSLINQFVISNDMSQLGGQSLLDLLSNMFKISGKALPISLPTYDTIHKALTLSKDDVRLIEFVEHFDEAYFGSPTYLKPFRGVHFDLLRRIAEVCYFADPKYFVTQFNGLYTNTGERVIGDFASGECFRILTEQVQADTSLPKDSVPLCIAISLDETSLNTTRSRNETPVTFWIYNFSGDSERKSFKCEFLGYAPSLPETKSRLHNVLLEQGCTTKSRRSLAIKRAERRAQLNYLGQVLKPLLECQSRGLTLQVGNSSNKLMINAIPFLVAIIGDNEGSHYIAGASTSKKWSRCRVCTHEDCSSFKLNLDAAPDLSSPDSFSSQKSFRSDTVTKLLAERGADIELKLFKGVPISADERNTMRTLEFQNIASSRSNPLYDIMEATHRPCQFSPHLPRFGLHQSVPPDVLHTFLKGCGEYCLSLVMAIVHSIQTLDAKYFSNVSELDRLIDLINIHQPLPPMRMSKFSGGISKFFNSNNCKTTRNTGLMTGGLPAWKIKPLLLLLLMSLDEPDIILPDSNQWCLHRVYKKRDLKFSENWSVLRTAHCAMSSTLEVYFGLSKKQATISDLKRLDYLIHLNNLYLLRLKKLSKELLHNISGNEDQRPGQLYSGIKLHMMTHMPHFKMFYGMPSFLTDMELPEHSHLKSKEAFQHTSKNFVNNISEMAVYQARRLHVERMNARALSSVDAPEPDILPTRFIFYASDKPGFATYDLLIFSSQKLTHAQKSNRLGLHPILSMHNLQHYLTHYSKTHKTTIPAKALTRLFDDDSRYRYECKLLHNINVSQNNSIPLAGFILHANKKLKRGSKEVDDQSTHSVFSFFEVQYANDSEAGLCVVVVRLMAIFSLKIISKKTGISGIHLLAVVCKMEEIPRSSACVISDPVVRLKYGIVDRCLDIDVVDFHSLHMPACVFSRLKNPYPESSRNFADCIFYQIPSSRIVETAPVGSMEDMLSEARNIDSSTFLEPSDLNEELAHLKLDHSDLAEDSNSLVSSDDDSDADSEQIF